MISTIRPARGKTIAALLLGLALAVVIVGCAPDEKPKPPEPRYKTLPARDDVPAYLKDSIFERAYLGGTEFRRVTGYGLAAHLRGTGNNAELSNQVREYMIREMVKRGFGRHDYGFEKDAPEQILRDPNFSVVAVEGLIPPGVRKDQRFDIQVAVAPGSYTTSLAHGVLYQTDLRVMGMEQLQGAVNVLARAEGDIFVNPAYALTSTTNSPGARQSLKYGVVLDGGISEEDRPLVLRLLSPSRSVSSIIENRINQRFGNSKTASRQDEAIINVYVPAEYAGDWEHFRGVITHMFLNGLPEFASLKARELARVALQPGADLLDISYCWEGLGTSNEVIDAIAPLMTCDKPDVAFAAARAAAFLGDTSAREALMAMAQMPDNPFQLNAVSVLGALPESPAVNQMLRKLLDSPHTLVRVEAYRILSAHKDSSVFSKTINEAFVLDIVQSNQPPLIYASRQGLPRIAIIGNRAALDLPVTFFAMDSRFSITSMPGKKYVTLFYRGAELPEPVQVISEPDIAEIIARLGGEGAPGSPRFNFNYGDVVSLLQKLADTHKVSTRADDGTRIAANFMLQDEGRLKNAVDNAPTIAEGPTTLESPATIGSNLPDLNPAENDGVKVNGNNGESRPQ